MKVKANNIIISLYIILSSIAIYISNDLIVFCTVNIGLVFLISILLKLDIKNPMISFLMIFILYQISYPILNKLGIKVFEYITLNSNYYFYSWIATISFVLFYGSVSNIEYDKNRLTVSINSKYTNIIYIILATISIISSIFVIKSGYQSKSEIGNSNNLILSLGNMSYTALIIYPLYYLMSGNIKAKHKVLITVLNSIIMLFGVFTFGERSYFLNYLVALIIYYFTYNKINIKKAIIISILLLILLSSSSSLKMLFTSSRYINTGNDNVFISFLNSDFESAGFNFNYLLNNNDQFELKGKSYIYDFLSPLDDFIDISKYNSTKWYKNKYWSDRKTGLGFSIIGEGYVNFGLIGIVLEMFIIARLTKFMYKLSNKGYYLYIIYIGYMSLLMYSSRQSIASIISPLFKYHILIALIMYFINTKIKKKKNWGKKDDINNYNNI